jgi:hypothetical protein
VYSGIQGDALGCREETYLVEHGDSSPLRQHMDLGDHPLSSNNYLSDDGESCYRTIYTCPKPKGK